MGETARTRAWLGRWLGTALGIAGLCLAGLMLLWSGPGSATKQSEEEKAMGHSTAAIPAARPPIDLAAPATVEMATFALGWFWEPDAQFGAITGVVRTRVGYAGGTTKNPTYHSLGDHTETIQVDYDPTMVSYAELLETFWRSHEPSSRPWSRQYMAAVFYHSEAQRLAALASREREAARRGTTIHTQILPATAFTLAEDYHQKYHLQQDRMLLREFRALYPDLRPFVDSTAAARVNGYLGGQGKAADLEAEIGQLGLSLPAQEHLRRSVRRVR